SNNYCRPARRPLYCPPEAEVLDEQGAGRNSAWGHRSCKEMF
ncbi:hypothetical protein A2U01_0104696, partial [Trifolium medium]|nr:hypothetical protein [Trifolium medium]